MGTGLGGPRAPPGAASTDAVRSLRVERGPWRSWACPRVGAVSTVLTGLGREAHLEDTGSTAFGLRNVRKAGAEMGPDCGKDGQERHSGGHRSATRKSQCPGCVDGRRSHRQVRNTVGERDQRRGEKPATEAEKPAPGWEKNKSEWRDPTPARLQLQKRPEKMHGAERLVVDLVTAMSARRAGTLHSSLARLLRAEALWQVSPWVGCPPARGQPRTSLQGALPSP